MNIYQLSDLLDISIIQTMAENLYLAAGMPIGIIDAIDGSILAGAGWQEICTQFHRLNQKSCIRCQESDNYIKERLIEGKACQYKCKNGLWDIGIPIVVSGRHLATLFLGQFFYEGEIPDPAFFSRQAQEFGYDNEKYLAALEKVPVFSTEKVTNTLTYNLGLAHC